MDTIVEMRFGSHLYGTSTPSSDLDIKAVHIPAGRDLLLQRAKPVIVRKTKVDNSEKNTAEDTDFESYSLQKFLDLVCQGQTVALDMLFATPDAMTMPPHPVWLEIQANRDRLLTRKAASFLGYCRQQANKYGIKGSRMAAARAIVEWLGAAMSDGNGTKKLETIAPSLEMFCSFHEHSAIVERKVGGDRTILHLDVCNRLAPFSSSIKVAHETYKALFDEYGKRALAAERNEGVDWKALSHAVRVGRQAIEVLTTGRVTFPRPEAARLLAIKTGQLEYQPVAEEIEKLLADVEGAAAASPLPAEPDYAWVDDFVARIHGEQIMSPAPQSASPPPPPS